jgi:hypothetical protein
MALLALASAMSASKVALLALAISPLAAGIVVGRPAVGVLARRVAILARALALFDEALRLAALDETLDRGDTALPGPYRAATSLTRLLDCVDTEPARPAAPLVVS